MRSAKCWRPAAALRAIHMLKACMGNLDLREECRQIVECWHKEGKLPVRSPMSRTRANPGSPFLAYGTKAPACNCSARWDSAQLHFPPWAACNMHRDQLNSHKIRCME
ncbi:hypothetical protein GGTG_04727 [Gaeumannomyces tritici R3-111a-1]|uniref:Uncharacterized protein n=1 Tax=Gaeumannomyces tritici (strain R3-111a-1) TaxID=644352 RepID=J3NTX8_GAET3|nr:hypothetical protein GGTG_04727 [Gaeumannomyces tritici R3-111a-1]EJT79643.1 hypothetical protein GGTG_04727 [Gaeumannomyces tritici R3-111a-1]